MVNKPQKVYVHQTLIIVTNNCKTLSMLLTPFPDALKIQFLNKRLQNSIWSIFLSFGLVTDELNAFTKLREAIRSILFQGSKSNLISVFTGLDADWIPRLDQWKWCDSMCHLFRCLLFYYVSTFMDGERGYQGWLVGNHLVTSLLSKWSQFQVDTYEIRYPEAPFPAKPPMTYIY